AYVAESLSVGRNDGMNTFDAGLDELLVRLTRKDAHTKEVPRAGWRRRSGEVEFSAIRTPCESIDDALQIGHPDGFGNRRKIVTHSEYEDFPTGYIDSPRKRDVLSIRRNRGTEVSGGLH